ncbi:hypothetical protein HK103_003113 [Boothiomyces macroporosus]|uniref:Uncharacterized protein n=1 Tax=Boothiomyces macroporosus TaxID=261099 RepID=A0AAD5Y974_9FUNG|nr:hypothetical protein HK103_003113 [Boothiomyces macroporosus]
MAFAITNGAKSKPKDYEETWNIVKAYLIALVIFSFLGACSWVVFAAIKSLLFLKLGYYFQSCWCLVFPFCFDKIKRLRFTLEQLRKARVNNKRESIILFTESISKISGIAKSAAFGSLQSLSGKVDGSIRKSNSLLFNDGGKTLGIPKSPTYGSGSGQSLNIKGENSLRRSNPKLYNENPDEIEVAYHRDAFCNVRKLEIVEEVFGQSATSIKYIPILVQDEEPVRRMPLIGSQPSDALAPILETHPSHSKQNSNNGSNGEHSPIVSSTMDKYRKELEAEVKKLDNPHTDDYDENSEISQSIVSFVEKKNLYKNDKPDMVSVQYIKPVEPKKIRRYSSALIDLYKLKNPHSPTVKAPVRELDRQIVSTPNWLTKEVLQFNYADKNISGKGRVRSISDTKDSKSNSQSQRLGYSVYNSSQGTDGRLSEFMKQAREKISNTHSNTPGSARFTNNTDAKSPKSNMPAKNSQSNSAVHSRASSGNSNPKNSREISNSQRLSNSNQFAMNNSAMSWAEASGGCSKDSKRSPHGPSQVLSKCSNECDYNPDSEISLSIVNFVEAKMKKEENDQQNQSGFFHAVEEKLLSLPLRLSRKNSFDVQHYGSKRNSVSNSFSSKFNSSDKAEPSPFWLSKELAQAAMEAETELVELESFQKTKSGEQSSSNLENQKDILPSPANPVLERRSSQLSRRPSIHDTNVLNEARKSFMATHRSSVQSRSNQPHPLKADHGDKHSMDSSTSPIIYENPYLPNINQQNEYVINQRLNKSSDSPRKSPTLFPDNQEAQSRSRSNSNPSPRIGSVAPLSTPIGSSNEIKPSSRNRSNSFQKQVVSEPVIESQTQVISQNRVK